ncbi:MAG: transcriptional regulator [Planctomycetota bacterium]|nr:MAG: transcriptional regulator [Planctomycetota bacterium]
MATECPGSTGHQEHHVPSKPSRAIKPPALPVSTRPDADRRLRQADRIARVLRVLQLIQRPGRWDTAAIAREIECSVRTVYRDLAVLELAGVPWSFDRETASYKVRPDFQFPILNLTDDELLGQATATATSKASGLDVSKGARATTEKLATKAGGKSETILREAQQFTEVLDLKLADHSRHLDVIRTVQWALIQRKQLVGLYESPYEARPVKLALHPYRLCLIKSAWYLIARPTTEDTPRTYRIVRFKSLRMSDHAAAIPADFDLRDYLGNAWGVFRGSESHEVELQFTKDAADVVTETVWHHTQKSRRNADGTVTMTFTVDGLEEIVRWVVGWAGRVRVTEPKALREKVIDQHRKAIDANR